VGTLAQNMLDIFCGDVGVFFCAEMNAMKRRKSRGVDFEKVLQKVAAMYHLETDYIVGKGRGNVPKSTSGGKATGDME